MGNRHSTETGLYPGFSLGQSFAPGQNEEDEEGHQRSRVRAGNVNNYVGKVIGSIFPEAYQEEETVFKTLATGAERSMRSGKHSVPKGGTGNDEVDPLLEEVGDAITSQTLQILEDRIGMKETVSSIREQAHDLTSATLQPTAIDEHLEQLDGMSRTASYNITRHFEELDKGLPTSHRLSDVRAFEPRIGDHLENLEGMGMTQLMQYGDNKKDLFNLGSLHELPAHGAPLTGIIHHSNDRAGGTHNAGLGSDNFFNTQFKAGFDSTIIEK
jgi:hypothetical protein